MEKCTKCGSPTDILYAEDDCGSCMEIRHEDTNRRLFDEMYDSWYDDPLPYIEFQKTLTDSDGLHQVAEVLKNGDVKITTTYRFYDDVNNHITREETTYIESDQVEDLIEFLKSRKRHCE